MKKLWLLLCVLALTPALSYAHENVKTEEGVTIEISGSAKFTCVYIDDVINQYLNRDIVSNANSDSADGTVFLGTLNFLIPNLDKGVSAGFQIASKIVEDGYVGLGLGDTFGQIASNELEFNQIWVKASGFLRDNWDITIGKFRFAYDPVGDGNEFLISLLNNSEPDGAELAFVTPFAENIADPTYAGIDVTLGGSPWNSALTVWRGPATPGGFLFEIKSSDQLSWDIFYFNIGEGVGTGAGFLAAGSGGGVHADETLWGIHFEYLFGNDNKSVFFGTLANIANFNYNNSIWTIGGGLVYNVNGWRFYGEVYYQTGNYGEVDQDNGQRLLSGVVARATDIDIDHKAWAVNLGVQYTWAKNPNTPYLGLGYTFVSGDSGEMDDDDPENNDFVSYEDNDSTLILEDNLVGLDVDSNYHKIQAYGGCQTKLVDRPLHLKALVAFAELDEEPDRVGRAVTDGDIDVDEDLGTELDVTLSWEYSKHLTFTLGLAFLWGADFLDSSLDNESTVARDPVATGRRNVTEDDDTFLILLDTKLKF